MKIGMFVNDLASELADFTTTCLAREATARGHEVWYVEVEDFAYDPDDMVRARAVRVADGDYEDGKSYLAALDADDTLEERIEVGDLDVLMLRNDPSADTGLRSWAQTVGINFGRIAMRHGVLVVNDPNGLAKAMNKTYFQLFPDEVRPTTLITMDREEIRDFAKAQGGKIVLKPLMGSGGQGVFLVDESAGSNLNQMIEILTRDGYVIAQEYLPAATEGDTRLFVMNGKPLKYRGKYAAFRRLRSGSDMRSNIHAGGKLREAELTDVHFEIAEIVRPKLVEDGMFLVGLDIVGDKLMEINVFSPGGLGSAQKFENVNFTHAVLESFERKVQYAKYYDRFFNNAGMATL
jgi:glutathione synthase